MVYICFCSDIDRNSLRNVFNGRKETFGTTVAENSPCFMLCVTVCKTTVQKCKIASQSLGHAHTSQVHPFLIPVLLLLFTKYNFRGIILRLTTLRQIDVVSINPLPVPSSEWVQ